MNQTITNAIESVNNAYPSIYTKDDVIVLLTDINEKLNKEYELDGLKDVLLSNIERKLNDMSSDEVVDYDTVELELDYDNRINLTSIDVNVSNIMDIITESVEHAFEFIASGE